MQGVGKRKKIQCMHFCLAEAMRLVEREHILMSSSMATHVDAKGSRLTARFSATIMHKELPTRAGLLGHVDFVKQRDTDATTNLAKAMQKIVENFCTFGLGAPHTRKPRTTFDQNLYNHIWKINEVLDADSERTVQLAAMDVTNALGDADQVLFGNNKSINRDPTHAARRRGICLINCQIIRFGMLKVNYK